MADDPVPGDAVSNALETLEAGETGGTEWGKTYQKWKKNGLFTGDNAYLEPIFLGNAAQQIADKELTANGAFAETGTLANQGSELGTRRNGNLLRPDYQMPIGDSGKWAILDITTPGQAPKISKYNERAKTPIMINIVYEKV
jgi:hypothetical protein